MLVCTSINCGMAILFPRIRLRLGQTVYGQKILLMGCLENLSTRVAASRASSTHPNAVDAEGLAPRVV
jgi:hypothetical protein